MDLSNSDFPIPNFSEFSTLLVDEDDLKLGDRKFRPLINAENELQLPHTIVHTVLNSADGAICADISIDGQIIACGFEDSSIKVWMHKYEEEEDNDDKSDQELKEKEDEDRPEPDSEEERKEECK